MERSEIYDVIRKRLFDAADNSTASSVAERFYNSIAVIQSTSPDILSLDYKEKMVKSYPFHPLLIDYSTSGSQQYLISEDPEHAPYSIACCEGHLSGPR